MKKILILLITIIITSSCATQYAYTPPSTPEGKACISTCQSAQATCRNTQYGYAQKAGEKCEADKKKEYSQCQQNADMKYNQCERDNQVKYTSCLRYSQNRSYCMQGVCIKNSCFEGTCYTPADYSFCDSEFNSCYQNCGGQINEVK